MYLCKIVVKPTLAMQVPLLASLSAGQRSDLCTALKPRIFNAGESIVRKGEPGEAFYIVESGTCIVLGASGQVHMAPVCSHTASVHALSSTVRNQEDIP